MHQASELDASERIAAAVRAVPGVADLHGGVFGEIATYLPGRRVTGVRIGQDSIQVHVSLQIDAPVRATAVAIQHAVTAVTGLPVDVTIEDIVPPPGQLSSHTG
jgi:uncharacterized alkaline shock family protein YloU